MSVFELTAKHQMNLGAGNIIPKGETIRMNIHSMGVRPYSLFSSPERRQQAIQQFAVNGIDLKPNSHLLNTGHWDIREVPNRSFMRSEGVSLPKAFDDFKLPWKEAFAKEVIDDVEMKKGCIGIVKDFYNEGTDMLYAENGLEKRCEISMQFYDEVKKQMGIDAELDFVPLASNVCGGYNPETNKIELNAARYLGNPNCEDLLNTILHESRHAFQEKCVATPESVTVKNNVIDVWKDNFDHYIRPEFDFEAYENQEVEKDANYFADSVMKKGTDPYYSV